MGFLSRLLHRGRRAKSDRLAALTRRVDSFVRPSLALVDTRALNIPEKRQRYALFVYGAITFLAEREDLDETHVLAILVRILGLGSRMHEHEVSRLVSICASNSEAEENRAALSAGAQAMGEWLSGETGAALSRLTQALSS